MRSGFLTPASNRLLTLEASLQRFAAPEPAASPPAAERSRRAASRRTAPRRSPQPAPSAGQPRNRFLALEQQLGAAPRHNSPAASPPPRPQPDWPGSRQNFSYRDLNQRLTGQAVPAARSSRVRAAFAKLHPEALPLPHPELPQSRSPLPPLPRSIALPDSPAPSSDVSMMSFSYQALEKKLPSRPSVQPSDAALDLPDLELGSGRHASNQKRLQRSLVLPPQSLASRRTHLAPTVAAQQMRPETGLPALPAPTAAAQEPSFSYRALAVSLQRRKTRAASSLSATWEVWEDGATPQSRDSANELPDGSLPEPDRPEMEGLASGLFLEDTANTLAEDNLVKDDRVDDCLEENAGEADDPEEDADSLRHTRKAKLPFVEIALKTLPHAEAPNKCDPAASVPKAIDPEVLATTAIVPPTVSACPTAQSLDEEDAIEIICSAVTESATVRRKSFSLDESNVRSRKHARSLGFNPNGASLRGRNRGCNQSFRPGESSARALQRRLAIDAKSGIRNQEVLSKAVNTSAGEDSS